MTYESGAAFVPDESLAAYGENYARSIKITDTRTGRADAVKLRKALGEIGKTQEACELKWAALPSMPEGVRWLLDNHYLAQREGKSAAAGLGLAEELPASREGTRLSLLCAELVRSGRGLISEKRCLEFLTGFQRSSILSRGELGSFADGLKAALILRLAARCTHLEAEGSGGEMGNIFTSLRFLSTADLRKTLEKADCTEQALRRDPAGIYPKMDAMSRESYRRAAAEAAKRLGVPEYRLAERAVSLAAGEKGVKSHVGYWLFTEPVGMKPRWKRGGGYIAAFVLASLFAALLLAFLAESAAAFFLLLLPVSELVKTLLDFALMRRVRPTVLPRLALEEGVPEAGRTMCVISTILTGTDSAREEVGKLERHYLANRDCGKELLFALLADLPDTDNPEIEGSGEWISTAAEAVETLNGRYGGGFYLFIRERVEHDGRWMGRERKRGAIAQLMELLGGGKSELECAAGSLKDCAGTAYLITLDSDTILTPGSARELIGAMLHPLNKAIVDSARGIVTAGHGIISPRMATTLASAGRSDFSRIVCGPGGRDPYGGLCSELYMDLFCSGGYAGKGIIDIAAYRAVMSGRIPDGSVLSHDALEGAFLRGGFMGSTELMDSFPSGILPYFRRMERWVRGDWQNSPWLFQPGRALPDIERFRLFDSLRRSLVPVMSLAAIAGGFFIPGHGMALAAAAAGLSAAAELLLTLAESLFRRDEELGERLHSVVYHGLGGGMLRVFLRLLLLPVEAWYCLCGICRGLWRMLVSHKNMLQWLPSAQCEGGKRGLWPYLRALWPVMAFSALLVLFSPSVLGSAVGLLWLMCPIFSLLLCLPAHSEDGVDSDDENYLRSVAVDIWKYFDEFLCPEDNFLPPDNYQYQPPAGIAHRTSPTNIGLALLSIVSALELRITERDRAEFLIDKCLASVEALEKWQGHLLNWYDTRTLTPLAPRYVSTVDSGNLCACLMAVEKALREHGLDTLAGRCAALAGKMDFSPLFDGEKELFRIGVNLDSGKGDESYYDLMASEARLTSFLAVARGDVPRRHWRKLSRALLQKNGYRGLASWTGTMFEYLMPELLLPLEKDSLLYESARFCLYVQRQRTKPLRLPWGISESAYYSLDSGMNYRYKAHGCASAALKKGMDSELVISPYSSFLALKTAPRAAVDNLRALEKRGMRGRYGFWEALDLTPERCPRRGGVVQSVMSHHLGMSLAAIANCLLGDINCRRFMAEPAMAAHAVMLQEKLPLGAAVMRRERKEIPARPPQPVSEAWEKQGEGTDFLRPGCCLLANRVYSLCAAETGLSMALWGGVSPYVHPRSALDAGHGIDFYLSRDGQRVSILPEVTEKTDFDWDMSFSRFSLRGSFGGISAEVSSFLPSEAPGEIRRVRLNSSVGAPTELALSMELQPLLAGFEDYVNHPAFYRLGLSAWMQDGCLIVRRRERGRVPECYIALACDKPCEFYVERNPRTGRAVKATERERTLTEPYVECRAAFTLPPEGSTEVRFALALAKDAGTAAEGAAAMLKLDDAEAGELPRTAAMLLGMDLQAVEAATELLPELCFPAAPQSPGNLAKNGLWSLGISGDEPIVCAEFSSEELLDRARELMDAHLFLCGCGRSFDLVFISRDSGSYRRPLNSALTEALWRSGGEVLMDSRGGVHIVEDGEGADCVRACAVRIIDLQSEADPPARQTDYRAEKIFRERAVPASGTPKFGWDDDAAFEFYVNRSLPPRAWSNMLTNSRLGFIAADCGTGNMWHLNSRENQLSPWLCDVLSSAGPERLFLEMGGQMRSLFAESSDTDCRVRFDFGTALWEKTLGSAKLSTTAFIPPDTDARVFIIHCEGSSEEERLHWHFPLMLCGSLNDSRCCVTGFEGGLLKALNPRAMAQARPFMAAASGNYDLTTDKARAMALDYDGHVGLNGESVFALSFAPDRVNVIVCGCCEEADILKLCKPERALEALEQTRAYWRGITGRFSLKTGCAALDRSLNGWTVYQTLACRIMARCSIYQSGGAYGFRDQLQDAVNLIPIAPALAREQILRCCARQYTEGDVQHWWHTGGSEIRGVRTRCSDDLVWLPWAVGEYVRQTGDEGLLFEKAPYITSPELADSEHDRYEAAKLCDFTESVAEHCLRAFEMVLRRGTGAHGLLPIGSGDWNDGFDTVGGESMWLTWFFIMAAEGFIPLAEKAGLERIRRVKAALPKLIQSADTAWDGKWYLRGYYADGKPMGGSGNDECRIDSIAQSFAALCGRADPDRVKTALGSACSMLYDRRNELVKLFTPPFDKAEKPGYITSYGPGFRENGGQYTHGALWLCMALLRIGEADRAWELLRAMLPADKGPAVYKAEPFVIAADVYSAPGHGGEAGWSWYTGSAGWLFTLVFREMLGLRLESGRLYVQPKLPAAIPGYEAEYLGRRIKYDGKTVTVDGKSCPREGIALFTGDNSQ